MLALLCFPSMEIRHSVCALDCPDACSLLVHVEDGRASVSAEIPIHPVTRGFLCGKVAPVSRARIFAGPPAVSAKARSAPKAKAASSASPGMKLSTPSRNACKPSRDEFGPEAILPYSYAGTMGLLNGSGMDRRFFHRLGASRLDRTICSAAGGAALTASLGFRYRHRARAVPPFEAHHRLGREHSRHQRASVAVHRRSPAQRREALHDRSDPQPHRRARRPPFRASTPAAIWRWRSA